jgi:hypothetical protein
MKLYRKDRLFANDREKTDSLVDCLKNVRITDETAYFNSNKPIERPNSPPHSPNVGHRNNIPRSGAGGPSGPSGGGGGGGSTIGGGFSSGMKGNSFTPSGESKNRGQSGNANNAVTEYSSNGKSNSNINNSIKNGTSEGSSNGGNISSITSMN